MRSAIRLFCFVSILGFFAAPGLDASAGPSAGNRVFHLGPGFLVAGSTATPGAGVLFSGKVFKGMNEVYLGLESGIFFQTSASVSFLIPVLATVYYRFPSSSTVVPVIGAAAGVVLNVGGPSLLGLMFMGSPGFYVNVTPKLDLLFRSALGLVGGAFNFYPHLAAVFYL